MTPQAQTDAPAGDTAAAAAAAAALADNAKAAPPGDTAAGASGTDLNGSDQDGQADFLAYLTDENRETWKAKGWKDLNSAVKSYKDLQTEFSARKPFTPPAADASPEELEAFFKGIGRPDTPDAYQFGVPEGVPADMPYDADFATQFKTWSHQNGLTPKQAAGLHDAYLKSTAEKLAAHREQTNGKITSAHGELTKVWGTPETEGYKRNVELAKRAVSHLELGATLKGAGLIDPVTGMVTDAKLAFALSRVGASQFGEDAIYAGPGMSADNPFSEKTENVTRQGELVRNDPAKAAILIRAAGMKPSEYGLAD
jgi:hypothetical protein